MPSAPHLVRARFLLRSTVHDPESLSCLLGLVPDASARMGSYVGGSRGPTRKVHSWYFSTAWTEENLVDGPALQDLVNQLLDTIQPKAGGLIPLVKAGSVRADVVGEVKLLGEYAPWLELSACSVARMAALGAGWMVHFLWWGVTSDVTAPPIPASPAPPHS